MEHIAEHNQAVVAAVRDSSMGIRLVPCNWRDPRFCVYGIGDSAFMNTGEDKTESQAGYFVAVGLDDGEGKVHSWNPLTYRSHKIKGKCDLRWVQRRMR